ncbi:hypothetical protein [Leptospira yasudae]|uniref:Restriction endonuclease n=1 Tax=Leptospira yasudae TaxID=2202201 RepID=A0ABX9LXD1_9LEPT|nr:hypothetical protein [Leptospira yasudae]RHX77524.1 hypothetical protein DLM77_20630 [Leptospira yasudae]
MQQPNKEEILEALSHSGYLFEQEVANIFRGLEFEVLTNWAYEDKDTGKSREVDILARKHKYIENDKTKILINIEVIAECKNNTTPIVLIGNKKVYRKYSPALMKLVLFPKQGVTIQIEQNSGAISWITESVYSYSEVIENHYYNNSKPISYQFAKITRKGQKWEAIHDNIYDAMILPIIDAIESRVTLHSVYIEKSNIITILVPIIVLKDHLYYVECSEASPDVQVVDAQLFERSISSKNHEGSYVIKFIKYNALKEFIENEINIFVNKLVSKIEVNPGVFAIH